jgi:TolA-binding protein
VTGTDAGAPFHRIEELEQENELLRERLRQKQAELERADAEIDRLRQQLKEAQQGGHQQNTKRKKKDKPKRPGRKTGEGPFARRAAPPQRPVHATGGAGAGHGGALPLLRRGVEV